MSPTSPPTRCPTCKRLHPGTGRCDRCARAADLARGTAAQRGYGRKHRTTFRSRVLERDKTCVLCRSTPATVADHHPLSRRQLVARGKDPDDPRYGRGLCASCHGTETAAKPDQRGGWNRR